MAKTERPAALMTAIWSLSSFNRCEQAGIATFPKVLINQADIKSARVLRLAPEFKLP
jgi:hypothetical protein